MKKTYYKILSNFKKLDYSSLEWEERTNLASLFHAFDMFEMTDLIYSHCSLRSQTYRDKMLVKADVLRFKDIRNSNLEYISIHSGQHSEKEFQFGTSLHRKIYCLRNDVNAIVHMHSEFASAVAANSNGLEMISREASFFHEELLRLPYKGPIRGEQETRELDQKIFKKKIILLENHGYVVLARSISEVFKWSYLFERACRIQILNQILSGPQVFIQNEILDKVKKRLERLSKFQDLATKEWKMVLSSLQEERPWIFT
ncbi:MAG: hypothetical protein Fur0010_22570 [Bdellovibrio sp.]